MAATLSLTPDSGNKVQLTRDGKVSITPEGGGEAIQFTVSKLTYQGREVDLRLTLDPVVMKAIVDLVESVLVQNPLKQNERDLKELKISVNPAQETAQLTKSVGTRVLTTDIPKAKFNTIKDSYSKLFNIFEQVRLMQTQSQSGEQKRSSASNTPPFSARPMSTPSQNTHRPNANTRQMQPNLYDIDEEDEDGDLSSFLRQLPSRNSFGARPATNARVTEVDSDDDEDDEQPANKAGAANRQPNSQPAQPTASAKPLATAADKTAAQSPMTAANQASKS